MDNRWGGVRLLQLRHSGAGSLPSQVTHGGRLCYDWSDSDDDDGAVQSCLGLSRHQRLT